MRDFEGKIAVVTGGGTGMGRELAVQLSAAGCHVALCDVLSENMAETAELCNTGKGDGVRVTTHDCDVSVEEQVAAFRDGVLRAQQTDHVNLLFNNAGIGGGGSFVVDERADWDRTFAICWGGVYHCTRAFLTPLVRSDEGHIVNTSSVNGFWASLGPGIPHTAYSAAKFAVRGFSEALIADLRLNAPHVKVSVVMPGHIGTSIVFNSGRVLGRPPILEMAAADLAATRRRMIQQGLAAAEMSDDEIRQAAHQRAHDFRDNAPVDAAEAARIILDGVREERWRILVGEDAFLIDRLVRSHPEEAYDESFLSRIQDEGHFQGIVPQLDSEPVRSERGG